MAELRDSQAAIQQHWQAFSQAKQESECHSALVKLERAAHKLKGTTCYGHVPTLNQHCTQFGLMLRQQVDENQPDATALAPLYQQVMDAMSAVLAQSSSENNVSDAETALRQFLTDWDNRYRFEVVKLSLFQPEHTAQWSMTQKQQFCRLFYHARGHFYKFLWLLGNVAPDENAKAKVLENIDEEFGGSGLSHERLFQIFAETLEIDVNEEFFTEPNYHPYLQQYNLGHLNWLDKQNWQGKWAGFSAYERLDNIDYHHLELLVKSFGITGKGLAFFKVHNKADHFDRTYDTLTDIWQQQPETVKTAFDFIGKHQLAMWQWLSDALESVQ